MLRRLVEVLLLLFLAVIGANWPELPFGARLADLVFIPLAISVIAFAGLSWRWRWPDIAIVIYLLGALPAIAVSSDQRQSAMELAREIYVAIIYVIIALAVRQGLARTV